MKAMKMAKAKEMNMAANMHQPAGINGGGES
jgi:hypothetical protein